MMRQILIIQTAFLGDVILTTPLIRALRKNYPESEIDFLTIPASKNLIETHPDIKRLIIFDKRGADKGVGGLLRLGKELSENNYDLCICPHRSFRSAFLALRSAAPMRVGFNTSAFPRAFTLRVKYRTDKHEVERNLSLLSALDIESEQLLPELYADENDQKVVRDIFSKHSINDEAKMVALAPGSVWATKRWPLENYRDLAAMFDKAGWKVLLTGGPADKTDCERIVSQVPSCLNLAGKFSLRQSYEFLRHCAVLVTNDSAPLHMGLAADTFVFGIFGATVPGFGFAPYGQKGRIIEVENLPCRPCGIHGGHKCPTGTFECMTGISAQQVFEKVIAESAKS